MKKGLISGVMALLLLLVTTNPAQALVIYDWVTKGVNTAHPDSGCGFIINAQILMPEEAYFDRYLEIKDKVNYWATLQVPLNDGTIWNTRLMATYWDTFITLSEDRTHINGIGQGTSGAQWGWPNEMIPAWVDDNGNGGAIGTTSTVGWFFVGGLHFNENRHPVTGDWRNGAWSYDGEWVLRPGTAPAVPEPGTFVLLGCGVAVVAFSRTFRRTRASRLA